MARVLVIEDDPDALALLQAVLGGTHGYDVEQARTGADGLAAAAARPPDVVVCDLGLPDVDGLDVVRDLRAWSDVPILVLSGSARRSSRIDALDGGADDYLAKPYAAPELGARLRAIARRDRGTDRSTVRDLGRIVVDPVRAQAHLDGRTLSLTPTQWRLLEALTRQPGDLVTHRWLIAQVWGSTHGRETMAALRVHLGGLRAVLGDDAAHPQFLSTESGTGYRWIATRSSGLDLDAALAELDRACRSVTDLRARLATGLPPGDVARVHEQLDRLATALGGICPGDAPRHHPG